MPMRVLRQCLLFALYLLVRSNVSTCRPARSIQAVEPSCSISVLRESRWRV